MKFVVINGTEKHGVTYRLKENFLDRFGQSRDGLEKPDHGKLRKYKLSFSCRY